MPTAQGARPSAYRIFISDGETLKRHISAIALFLSMSSFLHAGSSKIAPDLRGLAPLTLVDAIIQFTAPPSLAKAAAMSGLGGNVKTLFEVIPAVAVTLPAGVLELVALDQDVVYISLDRSVAQSLDYAEPTINALTAFQNGYDGTGVGVAIIDSGVGAHPDLNDSKGVSRVRLQPKLCAISDCRARRPIRTRRACCRYSGGQRITIGWSLIHSHVSRNCPECKPR